ncbi:MAG: hypothetical protein ACRDY3_02875 [Acidimicrobiales bacterium]
MSFASLLVEISYTRIVSYKIFYYYVFLVIGLALLGTGTGGVLVALSKRLRSVSTDAVLFGCFVLGSASTVVAYLVVAHVRIDTLAVWRYGTTASYESFGKLLLLCLCVFASFVAPGVMMATLFGRRPEVVGGLYFADLVGAGVGCGAVIYLVSALGAPASVMVAALAMAAGAVAVGLRRGPSLVAVACVVVAGAAVLASLPGVLPTQRVDPSKSIGPKTKVSYHSWGPVFRVDVSPSIPLGPREPDGFRPAVRLLYHDGILGAGIYAWDGKPADIAGYDFGHQPLSMPFTVLGRAPTDEAVIGAAGGHEVLASVGYGTKHIKAVELNPVTVNLVRNLDADFAGHLAQYKAVDYITGDGWSFMARNHGRYGLVWYPAPDSYAAANAGLASANVLSESYLYTTDAIKSMLQHLTSNGLFVAQFGEVNDVYDLRTARFVATARQALSELGVPDPKDHIMVAMTQTHFLGTIPLSTIFVKLHRLTAAQVANFSKAVASVPQTADLYSPAHSVASNPVARVVMTPSAEMGSFYANYPYNLTPTTDNDPYFWHFARFGTVISHFLHPLTSTDRENSVAERVLLLLLGIAVLLAAVFLLLPFVVVRRTWRVLPRKGRSALFFASLGFGFMFFEITLMQELNLFLGYPTYAVTITLMSLLVFTGLGALLSGRVVHRTRVVPVLLAVIAALAVFYLVGLTPMTDALLSAPMAARIVVTFFVLAPLGLCLGMFMPLGLGQVASMGDHPREYVAWGWAVNGFASVVGSALATILSMSFGFDFVIGLALVAYVLASAAWLLLTRTGPGGGHAGPGESPPGVGRTGQTGRDGAGGRHSPPLAREPAGG